MVITSSISLNKPLLNKFPIRHFIDPLNTIMPEDLFNKSFKLQCGSVVSELSKYDLDESSIIFLYPELFLAIRGINPVKSLNLNDGSYLFNVGINKGSSINEISDMISHAFNWDGNFVYDSSKPDGVMKKTVNGDYGKRLLDWAPEVKLNDGIKKTVDWYIKNYE